ncbi:trypsin-like peptidase domain-containing protein [Candidatus Woesearchaeota archaeon]|nr:trypsin-like peptidase domain-containing protein [Candidatus Woesearchaeota archaeon]
MAGFLGAGILGIALAVPGCRLPQPQPSSLEQLVVPSVTGRQAMMDSARMIYQSVAYHFEEEQAGPDGKWAPTGTAGDVNSYGYGSGVCVSNDDHESYFITAYHVVSPFEDEQIASHPFLPLRRRFVKTSETLGLVTAYRLHAGELVYETIPLEIAAHSDNDIALVRANQRVEARAIHRLGTASIGETIYGVGYRAFPESELPSLVLNERLLKSFDIGYVKSLGDPLDPSDDHIAYISMNTQAGNSGGPVFNARGDLIGIRAHAFMLPLAPVEDMINATAIRTFLDSSGYTRLLRARPRS